MSSHLHQVQEMSSWDSDPEAFPTLSESDSLLELDPPSSTRQSKLQQSALAQSFGGMSFKHRRSDWQMRLAEVNLLVLGLLAAHHQPRRVTVAVKHCRNGSSGGWVGKQEI